MRISSTGRYGMRIMLDVALHSGASPATRQQIAERQNVTIDYIAQLTRNLVCGENFSIAPCIGENNQANCIRAAESTTRVAWN